MEEPSVAHIGVQVGVDGLVVGRASRVTWQESDKLPQGSNATLQDKENTFEWSQVD